MSDAAPLPPQQDEVELNRSYPLFTERIILLLVLLSVERSISLALNLPVPPWLTVVVAVPLAYVVWATLAERLGGIVQLRHRDASSSSSLQGRWRLTTDGTRRHSAQLSQAIPGHQQTHRCSHTQEEQGGNHHAIGQPQFDGFGHLFGPLASRGGLDQFNKTPGSRWPPWWPALSGRGTVRCAAGGC